MIYIVIPIFNEEKNINNLSKEIKSLNVKDSIFLVFYDDGSKDNSIVEINKCFSEFDFTILGDGNNYGPGNAFNEAFNWICENSIDKNDKVVTIEADCTSDLSILNDMLVINKLGYNLVLASVYAQGGGFDSTNFFRKIISSLANLMFRFLFNVKVLTISSFYRVYDVKLLKKIKRENSVIIKEKGFICMLEILLKSIKADAKMIEVPMTLNSKKRIGKSNMKIFKTTLEYLFYLLKTKK